MSTKLFIDRGHLSSRTLLDGQTHPTLGKLSVYLIGDVLGSLSSDGSIASTLKPSHSLLIDSIYQARDLNSLSLLDFVGAFSLIIHLQDLQKLHILVSTCCPTPYFFTNHNTFRISFDENSILASSKSYLSDTTLSAISLSHQLVVRYPTKLFDLKNVVRCPCGHVTSLDLSSRRITYQSFLASTKHQYSSHYLNTALSSIMHLYSEMYKDQLGLLFSGGLDSSCLASTLLSRNIKLPFFHIDYKGEISSRSSVASYVSNYLGFSTAHLPRFSKHIDPEEVIRQSKAGLMTIPNPMYFGAPINHISRQSLPKYLITGQGADSIYVIDGFAPPTEYVGVERIKAILDSAKYRLALCEPFIRRQFSLSSDYSLQDITSSKHFINFVMSQCGSFDEHVDYTRDFKSHPSIDTDEYAERLNQIASPLINLMHSFTPVSSTSFPLSSIYRYIKWMRSLINCPQQDASALSSQGVIRLTPFLEGPIVGIFFSYKIREIESLSIKHQLESLFEYNTGISHRELIERSLSNSPSAASCGEKLYEAASIDHIKYVQKAVLKELSHDLSRCGRSTSFIQSIKDATQLVRLSFLL